MHATGRACLSLSREAVHLHREIVAKRRRGVGAPLSAPRAGATGMATGMATGLSVFQICKRNTPVSQSENQHQKGLHRPGIEPGSVPWQGTILPLDH